MRAIERVEVGGPYFEDFAVGQVFDDAPALTLTPGHAALHQALTGDRLRLALDAELSRAVTGRQRQVAHPNLVCDVAIGQSTGPTQRVLGNLFYRGLVVLSPVFLGDTLYTRTRVVGLKQNRVREGRPATGLVALRIQTENQRGEPVLDFWRCPMIPLRVPTGETGHDDQFVAIPEELDRDLSGIVAGLDTANKINLMCAMLRAPSVPEDPQALEFLSRLRDLHLVAQLRLCGHLCEREEISLGVLMETCDCLAVSIKTLREWAATAPSTEEGI